VLLHQPPQNPHGADPRGAADRLRCHLQGRASEDDLDVSRDNAGAERHFTRTGQGALRASIQEPPPLPFRHAASAARPAHHPSPAAGAGQRDGARSGHQRPAGAHSPPRPPLCRPCTSPLVHCFVIILPAARLCSRGVLLTRGVHAQPRAAARRCALSRRGGDAGRVGAAAASARHAGARAAHRGDCLAGRGRPGAVCLCAAAPRREDAGAVLPRHPCKVGFLLFAVARRRGKGTPVAPMCRPRRELGPHRCYPSGRRPGTTTRRSAPCRGSCASPRRWRCRCALPRSARAPQTVPLRRAGGRVFVHSCLYGWVPARHPRSPRAATQVLDRAGAPAVLALRLDVAVAALNLVRLLLLKDRANVKQQDLMGARLPCTRLCRIAAACTLLKG
jgi:hypothetical protein